MPSFAEISLSILAVFCCRIFQLGSLVHFLMAENSFYPSVDGEKEQTHHHVSYLARRNPFKPFKLEQSIAEAIPLLGSKGCHRLPVMNSDGELVNILSQSSVIDFLNRYATGPGSKRLPAQHTRLVYAAQATVYGQVSSGFLCGIRGVSMVRYQAVACAACEACMSEPNNSGSLCRSKGRDDSSVTTLPGTYAQGVKI
jgi:hypothetical protein